MAGVPRSGRTFLIFRETFAGSAFCTGRFSGRAIPRFDAKMVPTRAAGNIEIDVLLSSTAPLFAVPLGMIFLGERLPALALIGVVVTVAGIVVLRL